MSRKALSLLILVVLTLSGCKRVGNTDTIGNYYKSVKTKLSFLQNPIDLPVVHDESLANGKYDYTDPNLSGTSLYDTKGRELVNISEHFTASDFNIIGNETLRYIRLDEKIVECLSNLKETSGAFKVALSYVPKDFPLNKLKHNQKSLKYHYSGQAVDIVPRGSVASFARQAYKLCGCNIGLGISDNWLHLELRNDFIKPWKENNRRHSIYKRVSILHSAICESQKATKKKSFFKRMKDKVGL